MTDALPCPEPLATLRRAGPGGHGEHFVQFYDDERLILEGVDAFIRGGLADGAGAIVIATAPHLEELERQWTAQGVDVEAARRGRHYVPLEARETLARIVVDGRPDAGLFAAVVEPIVAEVAGRQRRVVAFGEMVSLLWEQGRHGAAVQLEVLWNDLALRHDFELLCAYRLPAGADVPSEMLLKVCTEHTRVVPSDRVAAPELMPGLLAEVRELRRAIRALELELHHRRQIEQVLARREQELDDFDRHKDEFLAMLGHELRNPLAPIRNITAVLRRTAGGDSAQHEMCAMLERQVQHMTKLLDDLLDVSRIRQGKFRILREPVDVSTVVASAVETSRPLLDARRHTLRLALPSEAVRVLGDVTRLVQMLGNLINNAAKYTPDGGEITISAVGRGSTVELRVADTGAGMTPEMLPLIFDLFVQAERTMDRSQGGLGIGLTLVRTIAELHEGNVLALSAGLGKGSEFIVSLPLLEAAREPTAPGAGEARVPGIKASRHVLIVDDNRDAADSLALLLRLEGHQVVSAETGRAALEIARMLKPDLILLDIGLPDLDGYEVARRLRQAGCSARLAALTGYGQPEDRARACEAGFDDHLVKPIDPSVLDLMLA